MDSSRSAVSATVAPTVADPVAVAVAVVTTDTTVGPLRHRGTWQIAEGVLGIVVGFFALAVPERAVSSLAVVLGVGLLFTGGWLAGAVLDPPARGSRWGAAALAAVSFAVGVCVLAYPELGTAALVGGGVVWLLVAGVQDLAASWTGDDHRVRDALVGVLGIVVALSMLRLPGMGDGIAVLVAGLGLLVRGVLQLVLAARRRCAVGPLAHGRIRVGRGLDRPRPS